MQFVIPVNTYTHTSAVVCIYSIYLCVCVMVGYVGEGCGGRFPDNGEKNNATKGQRLSISAPPPTPSLLRCEPTTRCGLRTTHKLPHTLCWAEHYTCMCSTAVDFIREKWARWEKGRERDPTVVDVSQNLMTEYCIIYTPSGMYNMTAAGYNSGTGHIIK